jgi:hypothetical protein
MARGAVPRAALLDRLNDLRDLVDLGLMSRASAAKTLMRLRSGADIAEADHEMMGLAAVSMFLHVFF